MAEYGAFSVGGDSGSTPQYTGFSVGGWGSDYPTNQQYQAPTYGDFGHNLGAASANIAAGFYEAMSARAASTGNEALAKQNATNAQSWRDAQQRHLDEMTPDAKQNLEASIFSGRFKDHPFSVAAQKLVSQIPGYAAMGGAAAIGSLAGPVGEAGGLSLAAGMLGWGGAADQLHQHITDTPHDTLYRQDPGYKADIDAGMSQEDAKRRLTNREFNNSHVGEASAVIQGGLSLLGPVGKIGGLSGIAGREAMRLPGRVGTSSLEAGLAMAGMDLGSNMALNQAYGSIGIPQTSSGDMFWSAAEQGAMGAALGVFGGLHGKPSDSRPEWTTPQVTRGELQLPAPDQRLALTAPEEQLALPKPAWSTPEVTPQPREATGEPIHAADETGTIYAPDQSATSGIFNQIGEIRDLRHQAREGGGGKEPTPPTADANAEPSQTPSAPLKSAQAAPIMPSGDGVPTNQRRVSDVTGAVRGGHRTDRTKPRAGRDTTPTTDEQTAAQGPSIPPHPVDDDQAVALKASLTSASQTIDQEKNVQKPEVQPVSEKPEEAPQAPQTPVEPVQPLPATPVATPPVEARPAPAEPQLATFQERLEPVTSPAPAAPTTAEDVRQQIVQRFQELTSDKRVTAIQQARQVSPDLAKQLNEIHRRLVQREGGEKLTAESQTKKTGGHFTKKQLAQKVARDEAAEKLINQHRPKMSDAQALTGEEGMPLRLLKNRAQAIVDGAKDIKLPKTFKEAEEHEPHPALMVISEAQRFLQHLEEAKDDKMRKKAVETFLMRENDLRKGEYRSILKERAKEAERALGKQGVGPRAGEKTATPEEIEKAQEEEEGSSLLGRTRIQDPEQQRIREETNRELYHKAVALVTAKITAMERVKMMPTKLQNLAKNMKIMEEGEKALEQLKDLNDELRIFKSSKDIQDWAREGDHAQPVGEGPAGASLDGTVKVADIRDKGNPDADVDAKPVRQMKVRELLANVNYSRYNPVFRGMMKILVDKIIEYAGDIPVYVFDSKEWAKFADGDTYGAYDSFLNHITIHQDALGDHTAVHEAFHAATAAAYRRNSDFRNLVNRMYKWIEKEGQTYTKFTPEFSYAFTHPIEMLTEMMSNPDVQEGFNKIPLPESLAKDLGITEWRKATIFSTILDGLRKAFGLGPKYMSAMEAAAALTEKALWTRGDKGFAERAKFNERLNKVREEETRTTDSQLRRSDEDIFKYIRDPKGQVKRQERHLNNFTDRAAQEFERSKGVMRIALFDKGLAFLPTATMRNWFEKHFPEGTFRAAQEGLEKAGTHMRKLILQSDPLMKATLWFQTENSAEAQKVFDLMHDTQLHGVHPDVPLGEGLNAHLKQRAKEKDWSLESAGAVHYNELKARFDALSPRAKDIYTRWRDFGKEQFEEDTAASLKNHSDAFYKNYARDKTYQSARAKQQAGEELTAKEQMKLDRFNTLKKVLTGKELNATEEQVYGKDPQVKAFRDLWKMKSVKGPYFPMKRYGKYVVTGRHDFDAGKGKRLTGDMANHVVFDNRTDAFEYKRGLKSKVLDDNNNPMELRSEIEARHYFEDAKGNREYVPSDEVRQEGGKNITPKTDYHVIVQNRHMEMAENGREALKIQDAMVKAGIKDVSPVQLQRESPHVNYGLHGAALSALHNGINDMENLSDDEREQLHSNLDHLAVATMRGNTLSKSYLHRAGVKGASNDMLRAFNDRRIQSAIHIAYAKMMPAVNDAIDQMRQHVKDNPSMEGQAILREMDERMYGFGRDGFTSTHLPPILNRVMTLGFMKYLITPANTAMHLTHPTLVSIPYLASKLPGENIFSMHRAYARSLQMMGGVSPRIIEGWKKGTMQAWKFGWEPTDYVDNIIKLVKENGGSKELLAALDSARELGTLHTTGFDFQPHFESTKLLDRMAMRGRDMAQEVMGSADAINRIGVFITAHEKWLEQHPGDFEGAKNFANDAISETLGLFSATNRARFLQSPYVRSIMQFKQIPLMIYNIMLRNVYNLVANDEPGVKWQALKGLTGVMGTSFALAGLSGAIPEPIRLANNVGWMLGLNDNWEEQEDKVRRAIAESMGPEVATAAMDGLSGMFGADIHHRFGINDLLFYSQPSTAKPADITSWLDNLLMGVPGSLGTDAVDTMAALRDGDYEKALESAMPFKIFTDFMKAGRLATEGKPTAGGMPDMPALSPWDTFIQMLGWTPETLSHHTTARSIEWQRGQERSTAAQSIDKQYVTGDKGQAIQNMFRWNAAHPDEIPMTIKQLQAAAKRSRQEEILGTPVTKAKRAHLMQTQTDYQLAH